MANEERKLGFVDMEIVKEITKHQLNYLIKKTMEGKEWRGFIDIPNSNKCIVITSHLFEKQETSEG